MTLRVNAIFGYADEVERDLFALVRGDLGLGDILVITDPNVWQMTYIKSSSSFVKDRLSTLINSVFPNQIIITAVDNTYWYRGPDFFMHNITERVGLTAVAIGTKACAGSATIYNTQDIQVVYDASECGGEGYWVYDDAKNKINEPPSTILFHELCHAFHWATRTSKYCQPDQGEDQACGEENLMRSEFSMPWRWIKDKQAGCGAPSHANPWDALDCFVVSAVSGSPRSSQVSEFHKIRDSMLRPTSIGRSLFVEIFAEYYQCAPRIVADMDSNPSLMNAVKRLVVEPLLDIFRLTQLHFQCNLSSGVLDKSLSEIFSPRPPSISDVGETVINDRRVKDQAEQLRSALKCSANFNDTSVQPGFDPNQPDSVFQYLGSTILYYTPSCSKLAWCLADPLVIYWTSMSRVRDGCNLDEFRETLAEQLEFWIASAPVDWFKEGFSAELLTADLAAVANSVMPDRQVRRSFATKILESIQGNGKSGFSEILREAKFL